MYISAVIHQMHRALPIIALIFAPTYVCAAGFQRVEAPDPEGRPLEVGVWYPSVQPGKMLVLGPTEMNVAIGAPVSGQRLPLIVVSHGTGGSFLSHFDTAIALADAGYIVAAVTHRGDNYADHSAAADVMSRPRQISRVIDYMLTAWSSHGKIDHERIGMFGFSAGGFTTLVSIGGIPDLSKVAPMCLEHPKDFACKLRAEHPTLTTVESIPSKADRRIKSAVIAAPALGFTFAPAGLRNVAVPVQLWRAEHDVILPHPRYVEPVHNFLPVASDYHSVPRAGHFDFLAPCSNELAKIAPEICFSESGFDRAAFHRKFDEAVTVFFARTLPPTKAQEAK